MIITQGLLEASFVTQGYIGAAVTPIQPGQPGTVHGGPQLVS